MKKILLFVSLLYILPSVASYSQEDILFFETFDEDQWKERWLISKDDKFAGTTTLSDSSIDNHHIPGTWKVETPEDKTGVDVQDRGLVVGDKAKHHAIAAELDRVATFDQGDLVIQ